MTVIEQKLVSTALWSQQQLSEDPIKLDAAFFFLYFFPYKAKYAESEKASWPQLYSIFHMKTQGE